MSNCILDTGYTIGCNKLRSGINKLYFIDSSQVLGLTVNTDDVITNVNTGSNAYYEIEVKPETSELNEKLVIDDKTGAEFYDCLVVLNLIKSSYISRKIYLKLKNGKKSIIVRDNTNRFWLIGKRFFCAVVNSDSGRGKNYTDFNGNKIVFSSKEPDPVFEVESSSFSISGTKSSGVGVPIDQG